ncbi:hypothetical protein TPSD3_09790 [Thioflexithrix psekupsensis]|uniref:Phospholipid/glycerol acyltransferase domain-containing protein n=2 Tax=Thioflexithrix psekupsensis TaxID=1570016 RepID=A0A251X928_9GAMM|nr:hypothetical protein TPSD3_09790 [Thioflexithrix psekupsensis]
MDSSLSQEIQNYPVRSSKFRLLGRVVLFAMWSMSAVTLHLIIRWLYPHKKLYMPMLWHRGCCWIFGLTIHTEGIVHAQTPILFVSNHVSYLDIIILGGILPGSFISKDDVAAWPLFGALARLQDTLFIERQRHQVCDQLDQMQARLAAGDNLILFPEGTSSEGTEVLPFKSALFKSVERGSPISVWIQPVSITYQKYAGQPMSPEARNGYAWYADMPAVSHMIHMAGLKQASICVTLHPAVRGEDFVNRKTLALHCQTAVAQAVKENLPK